MTRTSSYHITVVGNRKPVSGGVDRAPSVIVTDDGIATGATLIAALKDIRHRNPHELIVAVPVAAPDSLPTVGAWCDEIVCLHAPPGFRAVGYFFEDFSPVEDETVRDLLRAAAEHSAVAT